MKKIILFNFLLLTALTTNARQTDFPKLTGPYLGQKPPGITPEVFAPGIVSTPNSREFSGTFSTDGKEYYFFRFADKPVMMECKENKEGWSAPQPAFFNTEHINYEPHIAYDGKIFFFCSSRPYPGYKEGRIPTQVWMMKRNGNKWDSPVHLRMGMAPTTTEEGLIYINFDIFKLTNDSLTLIDKVRYRHDVKEVDQLPSFHSCISKDESYILFDCKDILYVSFRGKDGTWGKPINLCEKLNVNADIMLPTLSPDNKYMFFCYKKDIYWVSTEIIEELRPKEWKNN